MEKKKNLDQKWRFVKGDIENASNIDFYVNDWDEISLPHTWNAFDVQSGGGKKCGILRHGDPGYYRGVGWYRRELSFPYDYETKRIFINFEAAGSVVDVYLNGKLLGQHQGAFSAFCFEITDLIRKDELNILAVKVNNSWREDLPPLSGDFPIMGGLYRPVHLIIKERACFTLLDYASTGIYLKQRKITENKAEVELLAKISNMYENETDFILKTTVLDAEGIEICVLEDEAKIEYNNTKDLVQYMIIENPHLWNGRLDPYLYKVKAELIAHDEIIDIVIQNLGLRYYYVDPEKGFFLNGRPYPINGVNRHQDRLDKGWALNFEDQDEDLAIIMEMGANAVRLAHYQHSDYFYSLCDKNGILVWAELSIVNRVKFSNAFLENSKNMLIELIRQNFNHSSIFTWSLANEIGLVQLRSPVPLMKKLNKVAHEEDPTRPTILAAISIAFFKKKIHHITDLIGWNHYPGWYYLKASKMGPHLKKFNKVGNYRGLCVSEYGAGASIYQHKQNLTHEDKIKALGHFHPEEKQNIVHEEHYRQMRALSFVWGTFVWNMFDFAVSFRDEGDTPGRNDKGLVTYDRKVKKDSYFFYKTNWTIDPIVYITSRRHVERYDPITEIKVYSNCDKVELKINEENIGEMFKEDLCIFRLSRFELSEGENEIKVLGISGNQKVTDSCIWKYIKN